MISNVRVKRDLMFGRFSVTSRTRRREGQGLRMKRTLDPYEKKEPHITQIFTDIELSFFNFPLIFLGDGVVQEVGFYKMREEFTGPCLLFLL